MVHYTWRFLWWCIWRLGRYLLWLLWRLMMMCWWWTRLDDWRLLTRMDDVTSSRWWSDRCVWSGSDGFLLFFHASWVLHTLRVGSLKPLLVGSKRTLAGPSEELDLLFQLELKDLRRLKSSTSPHAKLYLMVFINEIWLSFPFISGAHCLLGWSIVLH